MLKTPAYEQFEKMAATLHEEMTTVNPVCQTPENKWHARHMKVCALESCLGHEERPNEFKVEICDICHNWFCDQHLNYKLQYKKIPDSIMGTNVYDNVWTRSFSMCLQCMNKVNSLIQIHIDDNHRKEIKRNRRNQNINYMADKSKHFKRRMGMPPKKRKPVPLRPDEHLVKVDDSVITGTVDLPVTEVRGPK